MLACGAAQACATLRFGFYNQEIAPYYMGSGSSVAEPPGAAVELVRESAASAGCPMTSVRLPRARLPIMLGSGAIDAAALGLEGLTESNGVYPRDKAGKPDTQRAFKLYTVIFVRAADVEGKGADPALYLKGRKIGTYLGVPYAAEFRQAGYEVDDGANDTQRNLEKLRLRRIDGFAVALAAPSDMDNVIAEQYGGELIRLDKPMRVSSVWLAFSQAYYDKQRDQVEAIWNWIGANGHARFAVLLKKYEK